MHWTKATWAALPLVRPAVAGPGFGGGQQVLGSTGVSDFKCDLPPVLDPSRDGLPAARDIFGGEKALLKQVERHGALVKIPSISYDDNGEPGEDPRWDVFYDVHATLAALYPSMHARMELNTVHTFGLVFSLQGSDSSLKPLMLTAHQDVVPVADPETWKHPPFSAHYDGRWLWGRGASDDKNSLTALMSALETLLANPAWAPKRTIVLALGFDEECSGRRGAGYIAKYLEDKYGRDSMAIIVDEGGMGLALLDKTLYALPAVMEKGHMDVWLDLKINGGHSSIPFPHTGIGIMSEIVVALESNPYEPKLIKDSPIHHHLVCQARYSPKAAPEVTRLIEEGDLESLAAQLVTVDRATQYRVQTSQSVDYFMGGVKINAMPEKIRIGVNHRVAPHNSIPEIKGKILGLLKPIAEKYGINVVPFAGEPENPESLADEFKTAYEVDYNATLTLTSSQRTKVAPVSPTSGGIWDVFSGTIQHSFAFADGTVVPTGELMTGNTDTRHYLNLSKHIYRWTPTRQGGSQNAHTVDEGIDMHAHMEALQFYYDLVRNFDAAAV